MKPEKKILVAFILNLFFSIFEFIGGLYTNSVAIISDAIHDLGDALSIGISYFLERISKKGPNDSYTYGYLRYSILGGTITTVILLVGSILVIVASISRILNPVEINYNGMLILAVVGVIVNFIAAYATRDGDSLNQKAVNLHMLEDVLGWIVVLIGAVIMKFTHLTMIDGIMSLLVAVFILICALKNFKSIIDLFLEKTPSYISLDDIKKNVLDIKGIKDMHHLHVWSMDGINNYATMHVVTDKPSVKEEIRHVLSHMKINHVTIEIESLSDHCNEHDCNILKSNNTHHHHH